MVSFLTKNKNENTFFINFLRIISCFSVINLHVNVNYYKDLRFLLNGEMQGLMNKNSQIMLYAVPMFLVITGYIFLGLKTECTYKSIFKYIVKFLLIWIIVTPVFNMMELYYNSRVFNLELVRRSYVDMIRGVTWGHMWYLQTVFFIYLALPLFKPFFNKDNDNDVIIFFLIFLFEIIIIPLYNRYSPLKVYNHSIFENYLLYVFLGAFLYRFKLPNNRIANAIYLMLLIGIILQNTIGRDLIKVHLLQNNFSLFVFIFVVLVFTLSRNLLNFDNKIISFISSHTLNIYIYHVIFLHIFTKVIKTGFFVKGRVIISEYLLTLILFVISLIFSVIVSPIDKQIAKIFRKS
ncbi:MAG: acyltransferase [Lachnospiraceae bacterium]|nr:acyltransferase [Lachnospiraceae bacterium]